MALAALHPAHGNAAEVVSVAAKVAIALLSFQYGAQLSPQQAWHGVRLRGDRRQTRARHRRFRLGFDTLSGGAGCSSAGSGGGALVSADVDRVGSEQ